MNALLVDTNCLISYFTDRNPKQHEAISTYVDDAASLTRELCLVPNVVSELVYVLRAIYSQPEQSVARIIADTLNTPGFEYLELHPLRSILDVWPTPVKQYGDATLAAIAMQTGTPILTFDRSFCRQLGRLDIPCEVPQ